MGRARRGLRSGLLTLLVLLGLSLVWAALALLSAQGDVRTALAALDRAQSADGLAGVRSELLSAETALRHADGKLAAPGPVVASWVPLLGRTPSAARATVHAALAVAVATGDVVEAADAGQGLVRDGRVDLATLARLGAAADAGARRTARPVADLRAAPTSLVPGRLATGVREAQARLHALPERLAAAAAAAEAAEGLLGGAGPRSLLVVLENNAELRGTGGLISVFAEVRAQDGALDVGAFTDVDSVAEDRAGAVEVPAPEDYRALWGQFLANSTLWKNVNMAPDVPVSSEVLANLAEKSLGRRPDGIVWLDVRTIAAVIGATGDAALPDGTVLTGENTVQQLLSEAYTKVADNERDQGLRRLRLRAAADVVVQRLTTGSPDPAALGPALARMTAGRHLAVWSARPQEQQALVAASVAGALTGPVTPTDLGSAVVNNFGDGVSFGNKLDYYARRQLTVTVRLRRDEAVVEQVLAVRNTAPDSGLPTYVAGRARPGTSNNHVTMALSAQAEDVSFVREEQDLPVQPLRQGDHQVVVDGASIAPGTTATWTLRYTVPVRGGRYVLRLVPQPLAVDGGLAVTVRADRGTRLEPEPGTPELDGGALALSGPFDRVRELSVRTGADALPARALDRLKRFWNEPVPLP